MPKENIAHFLSWGIFGTALEWSRNQKLHPKEEVIDQLTTLVKQIVD